MNDGMVWYLGALALAALPLVYLVPKILIREELKELNAKMYWIHFDAKMGRMLTEGAIAYLARSGALNEKSVSEIWQHAYHACHKSGGSGLANDAVRYTLRGWNAQSAEFTSEFRTAPMPIPDASQNDVTPPWEKRGFT
jgi:hypothetical protein